MAIFLSVIYFFSRSQFEEMRHDIKTAKSLESLSENTLRCWQRVSAQVTSARVSGDSGNPVAGEINRIAPRRRSQVRSV